MEFMDSSFPETPLHIEIEVSTILSHAFVVCLVVCVRGKIQVSKSVWMTNY